MYQVFVVVKVLLSSNLLKGDINMDPLSKNKFSQQTQIDQ